MENNEYSVRSLYEVVKKSLLLKDKDLKSFLNVMNDEIVFEYQKIKSNPSIDLNEINRKYDNYYHVYLTIRRLLFEADISSYHEKSRIITNFFLDDELNFPNPDKKKLKD